MTPPSTTLYRFEATDPKSGLWYNERGEYVFNGSGLARIGNPRHADMPMGYDERYHKDGRNWFSAGRTKADMRHWFNLNDVPLLIDKGYRLWRILATEYVHYEHETTFIKETCLERYTINPYTPWEPLTLSDPSLLAA